MNISIVVGIVVAVVTMNARKAHAFRCGMDSAK